MAPLKSACPPAARAAARLGRRAGRYAWAMRLSHLFFTTLRDDPNDAEMPSHRLLVRAGYVRQLGSGIYSLLPLGFRVAKRVEQVIREEGGGRVGQERELGGAPPGAPCRGRAWHAAAAPEMAR